MFPGRDLRQSKGPAVASSTERIRVKLPANFDPARHMGQLMKKVTEAHGEGFEIDSIVDGEAVATRQVTITEVRQGEKSQTQEVRLPRSVKPTDGEKMAVKLADQHGDGWEMTKFEPYLGKAVLTKLTPETAPLPGRCRPGPRGEAPGRSRWHRARTAASTWSCRAPTCRPSIIPSWKRSPPASWETTAGTSG